MSLHVAAPHLREIALGQFRVWECDVVETATDAVVETTRPCTSEVEAIQQGVRIRDRLQERYPTTLPLHD